jgi:hypothetical protein
LLLGPASGVAAPALLQMHLQAHHLQPPPSSSLRLQLAAAGRQRESLPLQQAFGGSSRVVLAVARLVRAGHLGVQLAGGPVRQLLLLACLQEQRFWLLLLYRLRLGQKQTGMLMLYLQARLYRQVQQQQQQQMAWSSLQTVLLPVVAAAWQQSDQGAASSSSSRRRILQPQWMLEGPQLMLPVAAARPLPVQAVVSSSSLQVQQQLLLMRMQMLVLVAVAQHTHRRHQGQSVQHQAALS